MAIGNYYPVSNTVVDADLLLGTKAGSNNTVNYTAQTVVDYLNTNSKISIGGQLSFQFVEVPNISKTISFLGGGGDNTPFSSINKLIVSVSDLGNSNVTVFLNYLNGSEILLAQQNEPNLFGHYKITGYTVTVNPNFYTLDLQFIGGNGNIGKNMYYDLASFVLSSGGIIPTKTSDLINDGDDGINPFISALALSPYLLSTTAASTYYPIPTGTTSQYIRGDGSLATLPSSAVPTLNQVLTVGNVSLLDAKIGVLYGYDNVNSDYGTLEFYDSGVVIKGAVTNQLLFYNDGLGAVRFSNGTYTPMLNFSGVGNNVYTFQNANGTVAFLSDIPSIFPNALTRVNDTNVTLTLGGTPNTALLQGVSLTLGWTGTLADSRIASAATWNAKQNAITLTTAGTGAATFVGSTLNIPTPPTANFTSLTTTGSSGSSTLSAGVLNVPTYTLAGLGGQPTLSGTGVVKSTAGVISYINGTTSEYVRGDGSLATFPTIPTVGTWGALNYPTWVSGTPFVKMTAAGTFALDTTVYYPNSNPSGFITSSALSGYVPTSRTLTINGVTYDLSADRSWTIAAGVTSVTATSPITSSGGATPTISTSMATNKLIGRSTAGTGVMEEITVGSGLTLSAGTLSATASGSYVPYTGATGNVDLGTHTLLAHDLVINHPSGSGVAASITKGGSGEALTVVKTSGSGNAASITGGTTLISELNLTTDLADAYIASAATWNAKFTLPSLTSGSVLFSNGTTIAQDNANFFWNDTNNRLGINTNSPSAALHVNGNMYLQNSSTGIESITFSNGPQIEANGPASYFKSGNVYTKTSGGNVGIGTSSPLATLHVAGSEILDDGAGRITLGPGATQNEIYSTTTGFAAWNDLRISANNTIFSNNATEAMRITPAGDIGIGTITPATKLDVNGVITATGGNSTSWNVKQDAITLTTTGTSGPATLVGATLNIPQYSGGGGGGLQGIHAIFPLTSGASTTAIVGSLTLTGSALISNRLYAVPFNSAQSFTTSGFYINCSGLQASSLARILVYSDLNGLPDQKLYESSNLDLSTTGIKTATTSFTITAGTTYWLCVHAFGTAGLSHIQTGSVYPLRISGSTINVYAYGAPTFGSAPTTFPFVAYNSSVPPMVGITKA